MTHDSDLPRILALHGHTGQAPAPSPAGSSTYPLKQPALPYQYSAQEPLIDNTTMMLHWSKHTATYIENVNKAVAPFPALQVWLWSQSKGMPTFHKVCLALRRHKYFCMWRHRCPDATCVLAHRIVHHMWPVLHAIRHAYYISLNDAVHV